MHFDPPQDFIDRIRQRTNQDQGLSEADVIWKALDSLEWQDGERIGVQEGISAMNHGCVRDFDAFDYEFRETHDICDSD